MVTRRPPANVYEVPLYTLGEAARIVKAMSSTVHRWARGYIYRTPDDGIPEAAQPLITTTGIGRRPVVPFVGLGEEAAAVAADFDLPTTDVGQLTAAAA